MKMLSHYGLDDVPLQFSRTPVLFIIDTSSGTLTKGNRGREDMNQLRDVLDKIRRELQNHWELEKAVDVSVVTFGKGVSVMQDFRPIKEWDNSEIPLPEPGGQASMCRAIIEGLRNLEDYYETLDKNGVPRRKAHVWIMAHDGSRETSDSEWDRMKESLTKGANRNSLYVYPTGFGDDAEMRTLENLVSNIDEFKLVAKYDEDELGEFCQDVYHCIKPDITS